MSGEQGTLIPGEEGGQESNPNIKETKVEEQARSKGWRPQSEWTGDADDWVPAKEFVGRQSLFDKIHSLKQDLHMTRKAHEQELGNIRKYIAQMSDMEYKRAIADLKAQRRVALREGEIDQAEDIQDQVREMETNREKAKREMEASPQSQQPHPDVVAWREQNPWFDTDAELRDEAESIGTGYALKHPNEQPRKILEYVTERLKKLYPEKFGQKPAPTASKVESGGGGRSTGGASGGKTTALGWNDLTEDQRRIGQTVIKSGVLNDKAKKNNISPREQYLLDMQLVLQQ